MNHTLRLTAPRTTDFVRVEAETLSDAACNLLAQHLDKALFVRPAQGHGETSYFAVVEIQGEGAVVARYLFGGIGRKGGMKQPRNPLERDSVADVERELGMDPGDLTAGEWEGEESIDAAWGAKDGPTEGGRGMSELNQKLVVSVDVVLLALMDTGLHFATVERMQEPCEGKWTLPGGTIDTQQDETSEDSARRILVERARIENTYVEQLSTFAGRKRDSRGWSVSIAHLALVDREIGLAIDSIKWHPVHAPGRLPFDHNEMLQAAIDRLRNKMVYSSLLVHLMPKRFTLPEIHAVYEKVKTAPSDISRFRRIVLKSRILEEVPGQMRGKFKKGQVYRARNPKGIDMLETPLD